MTGDPDAADATWEYWIRPSDRWDTTTVTIWETGGGGGFGMAIDQGVLIAATELDGGTLTQSATSYDLIADPLDVINPGSQNGIADVEADFHQFAATIGVNGGGVALYVNGVKVDETFSGTNSDWDGGDGSGLGRFNGSNHGGFFNGAAGTKWDAPFIGQMAMVRLYSGRLSAGQIFNNFNAVDSGLDTEGDTFQVNGIFDGTVAVGLNTPVTLPSGATAEITGNTGDFTYDPNGAFASLSAGESSTDSFTYRLTDSGSSGGQTASADVSLTVNGTNQSFDDSVTASEGIVTNITAAELVGNDQHDIGSSGPDINLMASRSDGSATWTNEGSNGAATDVTVVSGSLLAPPAFQTNFGAIGKGWSNLSGTLDSMNDVGLDNVDTTWEIWFRPAPLTTGRQVLFETGGGGNGTSIVYDADLNVIEFHIDGGVNTDPNVQIEVIGGSVSTSEYNQPHHHLRSEQSDDRGLRGHLPQQ